MTFITNSVGLGGRNSPPDVTVIQWMLIRAQNNYGTNLFDAAYTLSESGTVDNTNGTGDQGDYQLSATFGQQSSSAGSGIAASE